MAKKPPKKSRSSLMADLVVTCDSVSRDPAIGKYSLYGLFDVIWGEAFPVVFRPFTFFVQFSGNGKYPIKIELWDPAGTRQTLGSVTIECKPNSHAILELTLAGLVFKKPGEYQLGVTFRGKDVGTPKRLQVKRRRKKKK